MADVLKKHLNDVEMTYWRHFITAMGLSAACAAATIALFIHALVPFLFVSAGSAIVKNINSQMVSGHDQ